MLDRCLYKVLIKNQFLQPSTACWSEMFSNYNQTDGYLYIYGIRAENPPQELIDRIVYLINQLTECYVINIMGVEYIKYKLFKDSYDKNLILLNFIRVLWYFPTADSELGNDEQLSDIHNTFYKGLMIESDDAMFILTSAYKELLVNVDCTYSHSNVYPYDSFKVKSTKQFNEFHFGGICSYYYNFSYKKNFLTKE